MRLRRGNWIPVVAGILKKQDMILVGQRPENHNLAGQWEFPGGKIEMGETPEQALIRELEEELGIEAEVGDLKLATAHFYGDTGILLLFYEVPFWKGEPKPVHHVELKWLNPKDFVKLPLAEGNKEVLDRLLKI